LSEGGPGQDKGGCKNERRSHGSFPLDIPPTLNFRRRLAVPAPVNLGRHGLRRASQVWRILPLPP
jgi:hypothetical protein